jgi:UDP-N-acetylglucosamine 2-epimerase (non-hydrolysing)
MSGLDKESILNSISLSLSGDHKIAIVEDYLGGCVSRKILNIVYSYTHFVNNYVWRK